VGSHWSNQLRTPLSYHYCVQVTVSYPGHVVHLLCDGDGSRLVDPPVCWVRALSKAWITELDGRSSSISIKSNSHMWLASFRVLWVGLVLLWLLSWLWRDVSLQDLCRPCLRQNPQAASANCKKVGLSKLFNKAPGGCLHRDQCIFIHCCSVCHSQDHRWRNCPEDCHNKRTWFRKQPPSWWDKQLVIIKAHGSELGGQELQRTPLN